MSDIDISREAVEQLALLHLKEGDNFSSLTAITLHTLRDALDAQAGATVKPLVFTDEDGDGVLTSRKTGMLKRIFPQDGGRFLAPSLATDLFKTPEDAIAAYQADHEAFVLRCIEPTPNPLAEVAMRQASVGVINAEIKHAHELGAQHHVPVLAAVRRSVEALPTTFTHAELLAAVMQLPEVKALIDAARCADETFRDLAWHQKWEFTSAALAPFTREGGGGSPQAD